MVLGPVADHGSIVTVADAAHRGFDTGLRQALSVANRQVLRAPVAVVNQPYALSRAAAGQQATIKQALTMTSLGIGE